MEAQAVGSSFRLCFVFSLLLLTYLSDLVGSSSPELEIVSAERRVDLSSHIIRTHLTLKVENVGTSPASEILLAFPPIQVDHLAWIKAGAISGRKKKKSHQPLDVKSGSTPDGSDGTIYYSILLVNPLSKGESSTVEVLYVLTHFLEPFPLEISQSESQLVYYRDSAVMLSPYRIRNQETVFRTPSKRVESFTRVEPTNRAGTELKYGPYEDRLPHSYSPVLIHYENNNPFAVVEELVREIEISHWGNLQITDTYTLVHGGARHKGGFSRVDYQSKPSVSGASSFKHLLAELPPRVHSVYYRDGIGNISSSQLRIGSKKSELLIEPRYPLFGGWKATFIIGYGLPVQDFLFESNDGTRYLNYSFGCPIAETVVDRLIIKVVLPEGSADPSVVIPFEVEQSLEKEYFMTDLLGLCPGRTLMKLLYFRAAQKKFSYLDVIGRTVVVLTKKNAVPDHNSPFQVNYKFKKVFMFAEPLMLTSTFFLLFTAGIAYMHMDLSIRK